MSLIKCSECGQEMSDQATSCPHCGKPAKTIVIEKTSKKWKFKRLIAWLLIITAIFLISNGYHNGGFGNPMTSFGLITGFIGIILLLIAKFGSWWNNG